MAITSIKTGSSFTNLVKYNDFLGPNSAYIPNSFESIATATPSAVSTFTFSSIPSTYKHLQIRGIGRTARVATNDTMNIRINGDTGSTYAFHTLYGNGSTVSASGSATQTAGEWGQLSAASATASVFGTTIIDIIDYASTTKYKTIRIFNGWDNNGSGFTYLGSVLWQSTSAITSITMYSSTSSNYSSGSTFALYGIKG
jgi:hypothetical protein